jgi:hypothetical protein
VGVAYLALLTVACAYALTPQLAQVVSDRSLPLASWLASPLASQAAPAVSQVQRSSSHLGTHSRAQHHLAVVVGSAVQQPHFLPINDAALTLGALATTALLIALVLARCH